MLDKASHYAAQGAAPRIVIELDDNAFHAKVTIRDYQATDGDCINDQPTRIEFQPEQDDNPERGPVAFHGGWEFSAFRSIIHALDAELIKLFGEPQECSTVSVTRQIGGFQQGGGHE